MSNLTVNMIWMESYVAAAYDQKVTWSYEFFFRRKTEFLRFYSILCAADSNHLVN